MATFYTLHCNKCNHSVKTSGVHEFYHDPESSRIIVPRTGGMLNWVYGQSAVMYCRHCAKTFDIVLREFDPPICSYLGQYFGDWECKVTEHTKICPACQRDDLIMSIDDSMDVNCPNCKSGQLKVNQLFTVMS